MPVLPIVDSKGIKIAGAVEKRDHVDFVVTDDFVDQAMAPDDQFPQALIISLGKDASAPGKLAQRPRRGLSLALKNHSVTW